MLVNTDTNYKFFNVDSLVMKTEGEDSKKFPSDFIRLTYSDSTSLTTQSF